MCDVALDPRKGGQDAVWTYRTLPGLQVGDAVTVPLGTRTELGFVIRAYLATSEDLSFPLKSLRAVSTRVEGLSLPPKLVSTILYVSKQYLCTPAAAIGPALPPGVKERLQTSWRLANGANGAGLNAVLQEVLRVMQENGGTLVQQKGRPLDPGILRALKTLTASGLVERTLKIVPPEERKKSEPLLRLSADSERVERFLEKEAKKKPAQALTVMSLQSAERGMLTAAEIKALASVTDATVKALLQAGLLEEIGEEGEARTSPPIPSLAQKVAIDAIVHAVQEKEAQGFLLFGVTGSGKTEVYLRAAAEALRGGRKVLYLVPEIALATQAIGLLRQRFGKSVTILHSSLSESDRLKNWLSVRDGHAPVVLGARSALFAPLEDIGLIILDEEHEQAYKQESAPRYHSKQVALKLGELHRCPVVLGSATPSVESFFEAEQRERSGAHGLTLLTLPERAASSRLPTVSIQDLSLGYRRHNPSILSEELRARMKDVLGRKEQVILFLNRRAYAPSLICRDCGHTLECPNCSVSLSFHRRENRIRCHHCGWQSFPPELCPSCQGKENGPARGWNRESGRNRSDGVSSR